MSAGRATVKTVAQRAGVSVASVSRVLNGLPARADTIARVQAAVSELNYVPAAAARSLKLGSTGQIACAFSDVGNPVYVEMIKAIERVTASTKRRLVIHSTNADTDVEAAIVEDLANGYADGLIISPLRPHAQLTALLAQCQVPVVAIGQVPPEAQVDTVRVDSSGAAQLALDHLYEQGCSSVAFINGPSDTTPGRSRQQGYLAAARSHGQVDPESSVATGAAFDFTTGYAAARELMDRIDFDGLFCANDTLAIGALRALHERGRRVPADVRVASIDNTSLAWLTSPQLTSVDLLAATRGELAAQLLFHRLEDPDGPPQTRTVQPRLVIRESSAQNQAAQNQSEECHDDHDR